MALVCQKIAEFGVDETRLGMVSELVTVVSFCFFPFSLDVPLRANADH
jgi:hypothetical protein